MNVSPAQRLVSYLREFPLVRPATPAEVAPAARPAAIEPPAVAARPAAAPLAQPATATKPAPGPRLPRGTLLNIIT